MDLLNLLTSEFYVHKSFLVTGTKGCVRNCTDMRLLKQGSDKEGHYITRRRQGWTEKGVISGGRNYALELTIN